ncbi:hypothetical protein J9303_21095, partial [Bacillaceae bacterium Marseille-Q3522]|nr:hypothetical protein [Bacillaceae bacterium Marseille-Q3522]
VYVECVIKTISFRENADNKAKVILYIDNKKKKEITTAAFIIKDLSPGPHRLKLMIIPENKAKKQMTKEWKVEIPIKQT